MKITAITGSRADAVPLDSVIKALDQRENVALSHIHTEGLYGHEAYLKETLEKLSPDIVVLLGDRYETLVSATVATLLAIPICHLSGGDITEGAVDDSFRHAITKLAYWHFPSCQLHADRVIQMGESPDRVFVLGDPAVDALMGDLMSKEEIEKELGIFLAPPVALVCYHPETLGTNASNVNEIAGYGYNFKTLIISGANVDPGGKEINETWEKNASLPPYYYRSSYPSKLWISLHYHADALIGNSSGFIFQGLPLQRMRDGQPAIIMIGERQKGRWEEALRMFRSEPYPFGKPGGVGIKIAAKIASLTIPPIPRKVFYAH